MDYWWFFLYGTLAADRFLQPIEIIEQLRLNVRALEKNVSDAETRMLDTRTNYTALRDAVDENHAAVIANYERMNNASLNVSESNAEIKSDEESVKEVSGVAAQVETGSDILKAKAEGGATPQNLTRVEKLEQDLWGATDPNSPRSIDKFKEKLEKTEAILTAFENELTSTVQKVLRNDTLRFAVRKSEKAIERMREVHQSFT